MARVNPLLESFNAGELSPQLEVRTSFSKYRAGLKQCENLIPLIEGGVSRRPGSRFVKEVKTSSLKTRLMKFEFSTVQAYAVEMGNQYLRFYRYQAQITTSNITATITNGTFAANITSWTNRSTGAASIAHDATNGRLSLVGSGADVAWAEQEVTNALAVEHVLKFRVCGSPGDEIQLRIGTASVGTQIVNDVSFKVGYHCYAFTATAANFFLQFKHAAGKTLQIDDVSLIDNSAVEVDTPYLTADLFAINGPQSADVLFLFHASYATHKLARLGHTSWSLIEVDFLDGPYMTTNSTATTLTPSATTGKGITITASAITGINGGLGWKTTDVGRLVRIANQAVGTDWGYARIVGWTSTTVVTADVKRAFATTSASAVWRLGAWSSSTGFPRTGAFHEQRLVGAGSTDFPQTMWFSQSAADFENMSPDSADDTSGDWDGTVQDDDAMAWTISADDVNTILWLASQRRLIVGTSGGEWIVSSSGPIIIPTDITVRRDSKFGCANIPSIVVGNKALFVQRAGRKLLEIGFFFEDDAYRGFDMTRLASHISYGRISQMAYAQEPNRIVWAVRSDGVLLSMTYNRDEDVVGWSRNIMGGVFGTGNAVVDSVVTIPGADGTGSGQVKDSTERDEVWVIVMRTINGSTKRYIEVLERDFETGHDQEDAYYADSLITYDGVAATVITGLTHLEGQTVKVWADGAIFPDETVTSGQITLDTSASVVQIGLGYTHKLKTLKLDFGGVAGTAVGKKKRITGLTFILLNSHTVSFGPDSANLTENDFRVVSDDMDAGAPLFTGEDTVDFEGDWSDDARIYLESDDPAPFTLLGLAPVMATNDLK